jgi:kynurenine formamidase
MPRTFVDLSIFLENDVLSDPPPFAPKIEYFTHANTFEQIAPFFPGLQKEDLPDGEGWAVERVQLSTHNGTHLDAPYHFHSARWTRRWATRSASRSPSTRCRWTGASSPA